MQRLDEDPTRSRCIVGTEDAPLIQIISVSEIVEMCGVLGFSEQKVRCYFRAWLLSRLDFLKVRLHILYAFGLWTLGDSTTSRLFCMYRVRLDPKNGESLGEGLQKYVWGVGQDFQGLRHGAGVLNCSLRTPFSGKLLESKRITYSFYRIYLISLAYLEKSYTLTDILNLRNLLNLSVLFVLFIPCILFIILLSINRPWRPAQGKNSTIFRISFM